MSGISSRAMLVALKITAWSTSKTDKAETSEVIDRNRMNDRKGAKVTKALVSGDSLKEVKTISAEARNLHYELTLPWSQDGSRILPTPVFTKYDNELRLLKDKWEVAVRNFLGEYPSLIEQAKNERLGDLFKEDDYPTVEEVKTKFSWDIDYLKLPEDGDFRVNLGKEATDRLKKQYEDHINKQVVEANKSLWERAYKTVNHMAEKLSTYTITVNAEGKNEIENNFHASLVTNAIELAELLPSLNITEDEGLTKLSKDIMEKLTQYEAKDLKDDTKIRTQVAETAQSMVKEIQERLGGY